MKKQWIILYDPAQRKNTAVIIHDPTTSELVYNTTDKEVEQVMKMVGEDEFTTQKIVAEKDVTMYFPEKITKRHGTYLVNLANKYFYPMEIASKGTTMLPIQEALNYYANYLYIGE